MPYHKRLQQKIALRYLELQSRLALGQIPLDQEESIEWVVLSELIQFVPKDMIELAEIN